jgi:tetratricopeptide (TPR) repeat protein
MQSDTNFWKFAKLLLWLCLAAIASPSALIANQKPDMAAIEREVGAEHFAEAETALAGFLQNDPHAGPEVYRLLAFAQYKLQKVDQALAACEQGLALYPASRPLAELYVSVLRQNLPPEDQQVQLAQLSKQIPGSPILQRALGEQMMQRDPESTQALGLLSSAAKALPQDAEAHFFYGEAACFNKQDAVCVRELTRAHALAPQNEYADMQLYTMIAVAEDRLKEPMRAALAFERAMKANERLKPPNAYAALKYVNFLTAQGKDKEATQVIDEILTWDNSYGPAHFERAKILAQQGAPESAAKEAELALEDARGTAVDLRTYHAFLAKTYFALGRESDARTHQDWIESHQVSKPEQ